MADEITVMGSKTLPEGTVEWQLFYWFDLTGNEVQDSQGNTVVVESSSRVPATAAQYLNQATHLDPIDAGSAGFLVRTVRQTPGELNAAFLARVQADYGQMKTWWRAQKADEVAYRGVQRPAL